MVVTDGPMDRLGGRIMVCTHQQMVLFGIADFEWNHSDLPAITRQEAAGVEPVLQRQTEANRLSCRVDDD